MSGHHLQRGLFDDIAANPLQPIVDSDAAEISGLKYVPNFIDQDIHDQLMRQVDAGAWLTDLKRRVQHYGYKYDYKARSINRFMRIGPLPEWTELLVNQLRASELMPEMADQLIINEYLPGQGIANHIDCVPCFTDSIVSLSLGSSCVMNFTSRASKKIIPLLLEPKSVVVLRGESRYAWTHGIPARKSDLFQGRTFQRRRRVSLTFRKVILDGSEA